MKFTKMFGFLGVAWMVASMVFVSAAPASTLTNPKGTVYGGASAIGAISNFEGVALDGTIKVTCLKSWIEGSVSNAGGKDFNGETTTAAIQLNTLTIEECGSSTVTVVNKGSLEVHGLGNGNGTLTSTNAEFTVLTHNVLGTVHCIYWTNATDFGTLTGSANTEAFTATIDIGSVPIPRKSTDFGCGSTSELTATYKVETPMTLYVD